MLTLLGLLTYSAVVTGLCIVTAGASRGQDSEQNEPQKFRSAGHV